MPPETLQPQLYIMPGCAICHQVKGYLERRGVDFALCWITEPEHEQALQGLLDRHGGLKTAPVLACGERMVQGFRRAEIDAMLEEAGVAMGPFDTGARADASRPVSLPARALWVMNFLAGSISFLDPATGGQVAPDLPMGEDSNPIGIGSDPETGIVAVCDYARHTLTFFDTGRRTWLGGSREAATLATPQGPADVILDARRHRFYVPATQAGMLLAIDSRTGRWANGSLENSCLRFPLALCGGLAFDPLRDRLFVGSQDRLHMVDCTRFAIVGEPLHVGVHRGIATDPARGRVAVASAERHEVIDIDADRFAYARGTIEASATSTDRTPFAIHLAPGNGHAFVSCMSTDRMMVLDLDRQARAAAPFEIPAATRTFMPVGDGLIAASAFDAGEIVFIDTVAGCYLGGSRAARAIKVANGARGIAWIGDAAFPR